jgi:hypothetical protein
VSLETWFRLWRIDVNPDKSSAILFTRRRFHRPVGEIEMFEQIIPWKNEVRYLGISFDNHLRFNNQVEHAKTRGQMVRGQLNSLVNRRSKMSTKNKITIYRTMIRPSMMYGSAIWGTVSHTQLQKLQVVQNKFLRAAFNAPWFVRNTQLHREANLPTIKEFLLDDARKFYAKAAVHPNHSCANPSITTRMPLCGTSGQNVCSSDRTEAPTPPVLRQNFPRFCSRAIASSGAEINASPLSVFQIPHQGRLQFRGPG